mmetsp:Transcript_20505/g.42876  ORF Transcript_20505/g.42876 Transcript_20505/m.42876 type:complete len:173 (+) Transcript_20505:53-571(+)
MGRRRSRSASYSYDYSDSRSPSRDRRRRRRRSRSRGKRGKRMSTVDRFIKENELNESAAARLRGATKEVRDACIDQGWNVIENARNASAVVISRIKKIEDGKKNKRSRSRSRQRSPPPKRDRPGDEFRDGDWYCPSCGAHNYSRRTDCFKCGAKKPTGRSKSRSRSRSRSRS